MKSNAARAVLRDLRDVLLILAMGGALAAASVAL